jgi:hypothetical protein
MSDNRNQPGINSSDEFDCVPVKTCSGKGTLIAMYAIGLLLVGGLAFSLYWFLGESGGKVDAEMLSYLPADSQVIGGADLDELAKNNKLKELISRFDNGGDPLKELNETLKPTGLTIDDFSGVVFGDQIGAAERTLVFRTKKPFDKAKMAEVFGVKEEKKIGDKTYYGKDSGALYFPSETLMVFTTVKHLETIANKDFGKVVISAEMQELVKKAGKCHAWVVISRLAPSGEWLKSLDQFKGLPYLSADLINAAKEAKGAGISLKIDGEQLTITGTLLCSDKGAAEKAASALSKEIDERRNKDLAADKQFGVLVKLLPPDVQKAVEDFKQSLKSDRSGAYVTISGEFRLDGAANLLKEYFEIQKREFDRQVQEMQRSIQRQLDEATRKFNDRPKAEGKDPKLGESVSPKLEELVPPKKEEQPKK